MRANVNINGNVFGKKLANANTSVNVGKHAYSHHAQMGLTFLSNQITLIDEYCERVMARLG